MPTYIEGFEIDAVISEERTTECDITDHPVEKGVSITDHARVKPKMITMKCVVSDTPVGALAERRGVSIEDLEGLRGPDGQVVQAPGALSLSTGPYGDFVASDVARYWLEDLLNKRKTVLVSTEWVRADGSKGYKAFDNMMVQSVGETIEAEGGDAYIFSVTFKQITIVTNNRTTVKVAVPRAKKKNDKGNKPNKAAVADTRKTTTANGLFIATLQGKGDQYKIGRGVEGMIANAFGGF